MNTRAIVLGVTAAAGAVLLAGLGVLFAGSPDQASRVPASGLLAAAAVTLGGTIYLQTKKSQSTLYTVAFAILVVVAVLMVGVVVTHH